MKRESFGMGVIHAQRDRQVALDRSTEQMEIDHCLSNRCARAVVSYSDKAKINPDGCYLLRECLSADHAGRELQSAALLFADVFRQPSHEHYYALGLFSSRQTS